MYSTWPEEEIISRLEKMQGSNAGCGFYRHGYDG